MQSDAACPSPLTGGPQGGSQSPIAVGPSFMQNGTLARRGTRQVSVRWRERVVQIGGGAPVVVQSMTNTDTADAIATAIQVKELAQAGSEMVRITVNTAEAAREVAAIREQLDRMGVDAPLIGDFHYNGHKLLTQYPDCAASAGQVPHQPGQRRQRQASRRQVRPDDRGRLPVRKAGAHRRELGQPGPGSAGADDGCERAAGPSARCRRRHARGAGPLRAGER